MVLIVVGVWLQGAGYPHSDYHAPKVEDFLLFPPDSTEGDSLRYPEDYKSGMYLKNPKNFTTTVDYDPVSNMYIVTRKIGDTPVGLPLYLTPEEFRKYIYSNQDKEYWDNKSGSGEAAGKATDPNAREEATAVVPQFIVGGDAFKNIFGSNLIEIRPQGSATLTLGGRFQTIDNPIIPERNRSTFNLVFNQRIQMNVTGKIGTRLNMGINYDTDATFQFENTMKTEYTGEEDDIIQKLEFGNINMPLNSSLITGAQSLRGVKGQFQFGKTTVTTVLSEQMSQTSSINVQGGGTTQEFMIQADQYEANRHYFLSHYFRDNYERFLSNMPIITSPVQITRIEVWVTNRRAETQNVRNIVAFMDLGERDEANAAYRARDNNRPGPSIFTRINDRRDPQLPHNQMNSLNPVQSELDYPGLRSNSQASTVLGNSGFIQGVEFEDLTNARLLNPNEFTFHPQLGYVSLNQSLNQDEVLGVAFQYTANGKTYQVGEFSNDGAAPPKSLVVKMLKATLLDVRVPMWDLMMKNVYSLNAFQVNQEDFRLEVIYWNDETGVPIPFLPEGNLSGDLLLRVMNLDRVNNNGDPLPDGFFDFVSGVTILPQNGRIIIPLVEPFGSHLNRKLDTEEARRRYVFQELYDSTRFRAQEQTGLNKFFLRGRYKSASGSEIMLNAINVPKGSVSVTAGGSRLTEGVHYTVDYTLGRVRIIDDGILNSGMPIKVDFENNAMFGANVRNFVGLNVDHRFNENFNLGGTLLHLRERPFTQKVNIGSEPIANTMVGLNTQYSKEAPFLTRLVDNIPFISTKAKSTINAQAEVARLFPGTPNAIKLQGEEVTYIDDFESAQTIIDIRNANQWQMASVPDGQPDLFPEASRNNDISYGYNRARLAWYILDPLFFMSNSQTPPNVRADKDMQSNHYMREILVREVFPNLQLDPAMPRNIPMLDLAYFPNERGPYNYDVEGEPGISAGMNQEGELNNPRSRWGGIMRSLQTNNFEEQNIEFIQFWMLDPFLEDPDLTGGDLYINLGNISEDILKDGRQSFENGIPPNGDFSKVDSTVWGYVPKIQPQVAAFDNEPGAREAQDVGLDGLNDEQERNWQPGGNNLSYLQRIAQNLGEGSPAYQQAFQDPSGDNFEYYRSERLDNVEADIINRYKRWNNPQGNSNPNIVDGFPSSSTNRPDLEDINQDQTLSRSEAYFQYKVSIRKADLQTVGRNYITDRDTVRTEILPNGESKDAVWYQFKVPIFEPDKKVGPINDFRSIRFIRLFVTDFEKPIVLRFARFELVRGEWRRYMFSLDGIRDELEQDQDDNTLFEVNVVNIEENGRRTPVPYVLPPGIQRQELFMTSSIQKQNEQSVSMRVCDLKDGDARAVFRNLGMDMRLYKNLNMFVHAEQGQFEEPLRDGDLTCFIRLGSDYDQNYYEYEIPLVVTPWGVTVDREIWPVDNEMNIDLEMLREIKLERDRAGVGFRTPYKVDRGRYKVTVIGAPNLGNVRTIMIGVRNPKKQLGDNQDDGFAKCAEIWINELRLTGFDNRGGYAAAARVNAQLADFANITLTGNYSSVGFGSIDMNVNERAQEEVLAYDLQTSFELGKFFSEKIKLRIPMFYGIAEEWRNPLFNPLDPDIEFDDALANIETRLVRDSIRRIAQDYTSRRSINFANVRKDRTNTKRKAQFYDIENFSFSYAFSEQFNSNINTITDRRKDYRGAINYTYQRQPKPIEPFKKIGFLKSKHLALIRDFNFNYLPSRVTVRTELNRLYNELEMRNTDNPEFELPRTFNKAFTFNRIYDVNYDLTKALRIDFNARMNTWIDEPDGPGDADSVRTAIRENLLAGGRPTNYHHTFNVNYDLPFNKIPLLDFISLNARATADFDWMTNSLVTQLDPSNDSLNLGNTIQNSQSFQLNGQANLVNFYNKVPYLKKVNTPAQPQRPGQNRPGQRPNPRARPGQEEKEKEDEEEKEPSVLDNILKSSARVMMSLRNVGGSYTRTEGTILPGFTPNPGAMGLSSGDMAPGWGFVLGSQQDIRGRAAENNWISSSPLLNNQFGNTFVENMNIRATIEPITAFRLELTGMRNTTSNFNEFFRFDRDMNMFTSQNPFLAGTYSTTFMALSTAFDRSEGPDYDSEVYRTFLAYRDIIAQRYVNNRLATDPNFSKEFNNFPDSAAFGYAGYSYVSQDVIIPAFIAAYGGLNPETIDLDPKYRSNKIPIPNWRLTYDGLSKVKWFNKVFTNITVSHAYVSNYNMGSFNTNLARQQRELDGEPLINDNGDFMPANQITMVTITEQFAPFIGFNVRMKNSLTARVDYKKDRNLSLSLANNQMTEMRGNEVQVGIGYIFKDLKLNFVSLGPTGKRPQSNLELRFDVSVRDNQTVIRRIVEQLDQVTAGNTITTIKFTADYAISAKVTAQIFYDQIISTYRTSNAFPTSNTNVGFNIRINLAQ